MLGVFSMVFGVAESKTLVKSEIRGQFVHITSILEAKMEVKWNKFNVYHVKCLLIGFLGRWFQLCLYFEDSRSLEVNFSRLTSFMEVKMSTCNLWCKQVMLGVFSMVFWVAESKSLVKSQIGGQFDHMTSILEVKMEVKWNNLNVYHMRCLLIGFLGCWFQLCLYFEDSRSLEVNFSH